MDPLVDYLRKDESWSVINMSYASTRRGVPDHSAALDSVIRHLQGVESIHLVGHSMGNIVVSSLPGQ